MSQINANFQELISNNSNNNNQTNSLDNVAGTAIITSETLQGFSMGNQFAICANSGNGPVLLSCLTPMILPTLTSKGNFELTSSDHRGQNQPQTVQIQLASPFNFAGNLCNANNAQSLPSLGLSYINLSSLTNAGASFPLQITLNNSNNGTHQLTIPTATLNSLNQEVQSVQLAQNYQINSQVKFESELNVSSGQQQQRHQVQMQQQQQHTIVNHAIQDISDNDDKTKRKPRRRIPNKSIKTVTANGNAENNQSTNSAGSAPVTEERLLDHKGRPFIYNCPNCPKKFTLNSRLTAHLRCHTGIRPYTCVQCGFSFTQKSYLIRHAAVHTEERPFTCERCLKTYKHYGSLANHRKLHRKEDKNGGGGGLGGGTSEISDSDQKQPINEVTATAVTMVDESNFDNILQLHSDWSAMDNSATTTTTTYIITNSNHNNVLAGTGPVAFPDQPPMSLESAAKSNQASTVFMDLHLIPSSSSNNHQSHISNDNTLYADHQLTQSSQHVAASYSTT